jgi:uncharacterized protein YjdB
MLLAGCEDDGTGSPLAVVDHSEHPVAAVVVAPDIATVVNGDSLRFTAVPSCGCGEVLQRSVAWVVDEPEVAIVHQDGSLHTRAPGIATLRAVVDGTEAEARVIVEPRGTLVGAAGGTAESPDGLVSLTFPPGALRGPTDIVIEPADGLPIDQRPVYIDGTAYRFSPEGIHFETPAVLTLRFDGAALPDGIHRSGLRLHAVEEGRWVEVPASAIEGEPDQVVGGIEHFSIYGVAAIRDAVSCVSLTPGSVALAIGAEVRLQAELIDARGEAVQDRELIWSTSDPGVVSVEEGLVRAVGLGEAVVSVESEDAVGTAVVTVVEPANRVVLDPEDSTIFLRDILQLNARVVGGDGAELDRPVVWTSDDDRVARVDASGTVYGVGGGMATIRVAVSGPVEVFAEARVTVLWLPVSLEVTAEKTDVWVGSSTTLVAVARDADGNPVEAPVEWRSDSPTEAKVGRDGTVTGIAAGDATISATMHGVTGSQAMRVVGPVVDLVLDPTVLDLQVGVESVVTAALVDPKGRSLDLPINWSVDAPDVVELKVAGQGGREATLKGLIPGTATLSAAGQALNTTLLVTVTADDGHGGGGQGGGGQGGGPPDDGHDEGFGNNLSWPVVFSEGIGITGLGVDEDTGLRPRPEESQTVPSLPFWSPDNQPDYAGQYYEQQGANTWQAEWVDGTPSGVQSTSVFWGDNLTHHTWNTHSVIRIEHALTAIDPSTLQGFPMSYLYGSGPSEMQGSDGSLGPFQPTVYSVMPELVLQKLDNDTREVIHEIDVGSIAGGLGQDGPGFYSAEVNVGGKVIYGYNWFLRNASLPDGVHKYGWWRIIFRLRDQADVGGVSVFRNTSLDVCGNTEVVSSSEEGETLTYTPQIDPATQTTWLDIWVDQAGGGGGGGSGGGGGGGGHDPAGGGDHTGGGS